MGTERKTFVINQTGPAIGSGNAAFMVGIADEKYLGTEDSYNDAMDLVTKYVRDILKYNESVVIVFNVWKGE